MTIQDVYKVTNIAWKAFKQYAESKKTAQDMDDCIHAFERIVEENKDSSSLKEIAKAFFSAAIDIEKEGP